MSIQITQLTSEQQRLLGSGEFGLEKESLRITDSGHLSHTPHPFPNDPKRDRDFCEDQVEMITGIHDSIPSVCGELAELHHQSVEQLLHLKSGAEYLWPFSNPPYVCGEEDIPIAHFTGSLAAKEQYREYLAGKYGKKKMLFSGIHFNFSFPQELLEADFKNSTLSSFQEYKNRLYLDLAGKVLEHSWLIVFLTAASPLFDGSYFQTEQLGKTVVSRYASPRCSEIGYWNQFLPVLQFESLTAYADSIQAYVDDGQLRESSELYYPVRLKPKGLNSLQKLKENGVNHIELRMFDLNPLAEIGIDPRDLEFVFYLLVYLAVQPEKTVLAAEQVIAIRNMKRAALLNQEEILIETGWHELKTVTDAAAEILNQMEQCLTPYLSAAAIEPILQYQRSKLTDPDTRYPQQLIDRYTSDFVGRSLSDLKQRVSVKVCSEW